MLSTLSEVPTPSFTKRMLFVLKKKMVKLGVLPSYVQLKKILQISQIIF
jgi:hypothetical protein